MKNVAYHTFPVQSLQFFLLFYQEKNVFTYWMDENKHQIK